MLVTQFETARRTQTEALYAQLQLAECVDFLPLVAIILQTVALLAALSPDSLAEPPALGKADFAHYVARFNSLESAPGSFSFRMRRRRNGWRRTCRCSICPDAELEETYYFRWWTFRKHIRQTPQGFVVTEFLAPVRHAGPYNTISCAVRASFGGRLVAARSTNTR